MSEAGRVVFREIPPGEYTVQVEKPGFQTAKSTFTMPEDDYTVNVTLTPTQQQPPSQPPSQQPPSQPTPVPQSVSPLLKIVGIAAIAVLGLLILGSLARRDKDEEEKK